MFCTGCGTQSIENDLFCAGCGNAHRDTTGREVQPAPKPAVFHVAQMAQSQTIPDGVRGWSWGAFCLNWIWAVGNNTWIGLWALVPYVNVFIAIWLGCKGREMAWRNGRWDSVEHFNRVQRKWSQWGLGIWLCMLLIVASFQTAIIYAAINHMKHENSEAAVLKQDSAEVVRNTG